MDNSSNVDCWRCQACNTLIYRVEYVDGHDHPVPAPNAPTPTYGNTEYREVCLVCKSMLSTVADSAYFSKLHTEWADKVSSARRTNS